MEEQPIQLFEVSTGGAAMANMTQAGSLVHSLRANDSLRGRQQTCRVERELGGKGIHDGQIKSDMKDRRAPVKGKDIAIKVTIGRHQSA